MASGRGKGPSQPHVRGLLPSPKPQAVGGFAIPSGESGRLRKCSPHSSPRPEWEGAGSLPPVFPGTLRKPPGSSSPRFLG